MKKLIALSLALVMFVCCFAACGKEEPSDKGNAEEVTESVTQAVEEMPSAEGSTAAEEASAPQEGITAEEGSSVPDGTEAVTGETTTAAVVDYLGEEIDFGVKRFDFSKVDPDPSKWTMQQIVDCYKSGMAAEDHSGVQTDQKFELLGDLPGILDGPVKLAMKLAAQPYGALTGGYWDITPSDLTKADAHKEGDYVVINLYPKNQTDGPNGNEHEGTVGHVVNVVQGIDDFIGYVEENFSVLNAKYDEDSVVLKYSNAYAKNIRINTKTGKMESGTWGYIIDVYLDHCSMAGIDFENFHTTIGWTCWYPVK